MTKYTADESRIWYNALPAKRSSAALIIRQGDTVLMVKDDYKSAMTFPGGVIDPGEAPLGAALREAFEEVGLLFTPEQVSFVTVAYVPEVNGFLDRYHFFFMVEADGLSHEDIKHETSIEYYEWVLLHELADRAGNRPTYETIQNMLAHGQAVQYYEVDNSKR